MATISPGELLVDALKQALRAHESKPHFYAMVLKGSAGGQLAVSRKKILPKSIAEMRKEVGSATVITGVCFGEDAALVFECADEPLPSWDMAARRLAKEAGLSIHPAFRRGRSDADAGVEAEDEGEAEASDATAAPAEPPVVEKSADEQAFTARLKAMLPRLAAAGARPEAQQAKLKLGEAGGAAQHKDWTTAKALLDEAERILASGAAAGTVAPVDEMAAFNHRLAGLVPAIKDAKSPELTLKVSQAAALVRGKDFAAAKTLLDEVEAALVSQAAPPRAGAPSWKDARQAWQDANDAVNDQLNALRVAVLNHAKSDAEHAEALAEIADKGLNALTGDHRVKLMAAVLEIGSGDAAQLKAHGAKALAMVEAFKDFLAGSDKVTACEANPFDVEVRLRASLDPALDQLAGVLRASQAQEFQA